VFVRRIVRVMSHPFIGCRADPIAMRLAKLYAFCGLLHEFSSVRSTNVYEEKSLGIFENDEDDGEDEEDFELTGPRVTVWGRYLAMHARKQLAFGMFSSCSLGSRI
jgi:hypothetical protein